MNQLRPILRSNPTKAQRLILTSARLDEPPSHGKSRTLAALGLSGTLLATTQVANAVTAASISGTTAATVVGSTLSVGLATLKGIAIGLVAGSAVYGSIVAVRESPQPTVVQQLQKLAPSRDLLQQSGELHRESLDAPVATTKAETTSPPVMTVAASESRSAVQNTETTHELVASAESFDLPKSRSSLAKSPKASAFASRAKDSPIARTSTVRGSSSSTAVSPVPIPTAAANAAAPKPRVPEQSPLESEIAILDFAQRALAAGQPAVALQDLETYRRLFPNPHLLPEATLVRIEALLALGRSTEARTLGERLLAAQPTGALAQRLKSLLEPLPAP